jgi:hypothetical protein
MPHLVWQSLRQPGPGPIRHGCFSTNPNRFPSPPPPHLTEPCDARVLSQRRELSRLTCLRQDLQGAGAGRPGVEPGAPRGAWRTAGRCQVGANCYVSLLTAWLGCVATAWWLKVTAWYEKLDWLFDNWMVRRLAAVAWLIAAAWFIYSLIAW